MALGIGANTAVFSVVHAVLLNPLPYPDPDRIVTLTYLYSGGVGTGDRSRQVSVPDFLDWQRASTSFDAMAYLSTGRGSATTGSIAEFAVITRVSDRFFRAFAVQPASGRTFSDDEIREGGPLAAMVSERYARQQFGEPQFALGGPCDCPIKSYPLSVCCRQRSIFPLPRTSGCPCVPAPRKRPDAAITLSLSRV